MENLINNPGLQHVAENIFLNLDSDNLIICQQINQDSQQILENPNFWLKKWIISGGLSQKNQITWRKAIKLARQNTKMETKIVSYMKKVQEKRGSIDIPCYINGNSIEKVEKLIQKIGFEEAFQTILSSPCKSDDNTLGVKIRNLKVDFKTGST